VREEKYLNSINVKVHNYENMLDISDIIIKCIPYQASIGWRFLLGTEYVSGVWVDGTTAGVVRHSLAAGTSRHHASPELHKGITWENGDCCSICLLWGDFV